MAVQKKKPQVVFIMGPTATGKTDLAVALGEQLPSEIISVDSSLVYRGMDVGTAKPDESLLARAPHHLIDIRDPAQSYSAAEFAKDAVALIEDICRRGRTPVLVGGTMLYFKVLLEGLADLPPSSQPVRDDICREAEAQGWPALHKQLADVDPETAASLHPNHSQRIQRALEIYRLTGVPASKLKARQPQQGDILPITEDYSVTQIALLPKNRALLHSRIAQRFYNMLELGFEEEVRSLYERGDLNPAMPAIRAVGYRQMWQYLEGEISWDEMIEKAVAATRQLAKRQLTWLRGWPDLHPEFIDDGAGNLVTAEYLLASALKVLR